MDEEGANNEENFVQDEGIAQEVAENIIDEEGKDDENVDEPTTAEVKEDVADLETAMDETETDAEKSTMEETEEQSEEMEPEDKDSEATEADEMSSEELEEGSIIPDAEKQPETKLDKKTIEQLQDAGEMQEEAEASGVVEPTEKPVVVTQHKKKSTKKRRSIVYPVGSRFREDDDEDQRPSGDFGIAGEGAEPIKFYKYMDRDIEEEEEERVEVEEEIVRIDREPLYEKHAYLVKAIADETLKNNILQKKLAKYFKRKKMDHVLKETDQQLDTQHKYGKKLDAYGELTTVDSEQRNAINRELDNLREERESKFHELNKLFQDMQQREKEIGYGLINTKTGKAIPDKLVERLLRRQTNQMETVSVMRLKFIQLKNIVVEKQDAITAIDKIGDDLYLMDYEQLKVENRSLTDKIEEKEEELTKLRTKCQNTIQILAHMREKSAALESDIDDLNDDLSVVNTQSSQVREYLNSLKQERDYYRNMTNKLRNESGLLTETELLRDMEDSMEELKLLTTELEFMKEENKIKAQQIRNIRKNIEHPPESLLKKNYKNIPDKSVSRSHLYRGRPSLHKPTLPDDAFKHLKEFKPKSAFRRKRK